MSIVQLSSSDIETLLFRPDDGEICPAVKLIYLPNKQEYVCNDYESQAENRRKGVMLLLHDLTSAYPNISVPKVVLFDYVRTLEPNTPCKGIVRELIWDFKNSNWNYYIESEGKNVPERYVDSDLELIDI